MKGLSHNILKYVFQISLEVLSFETSYLKLKLVDGLEITQKIWAVIMYSVSYFNNVLCFLLW